MNLTPFTLYSFEILTKLSHSKHCSQAQDMTSLKAMKVTAADEIKGTGHY